ncbi:sulfotransferase family protein [Kitasatospora purpeofusca]|uniref:sulfotransferase-like domain-containing protein n=1 Tax=Kitasatospora purpeofusca TaxID=67352 RepID=UPI003F4AA950
MTEQPSLLALWSVPRSRSTAFERAMYERGDFLVVHEPFSRVCDFGEADVAGRSCGSQEEVMAALVETAAERPVFFKDTTDFPLDRLGTDPAFLRRCRHAAMVRNPRDTVRSHLVMQADATSSAMGFGHLWDIVGTVTAAGLPMHLVDGDRLAGGAEAEVRRYCEAMGIDFRAEALAFKQQPPASWEATGRWHAAAGESNALGAAPAGRKPFPAELERTAEEFERDQLPYYARIKAALGGAPAPAGG